MRFGLPAPRLLLSALLALPLFAQTIPRPSGDLTIKLPFGETTLAQYKGKVIVFAFILTSCPHCQQTTGVLNEIQKTYGPKGVQFLLAAINPDAPGKLAEFMKLYKPAFPMGSVDPNLVGGYAQFGPSVRPTVPIMFFIDRNFNIRRQAMGSDKIFNEGDQGANIRAEIDKLLAERPAAATPPAKKK